MNATESPLTPESDARVQALFERAKLLAPDQWPLFLASAVGEEIDLVERVLERLRARAKADGFSSTASAPATTPPPESDPWVGRMLGDYRIERRIGRGGMGVVFKARHDKLGREVALKVLPVQALAKPNRAARFEKEARTAGRLRHPHIIDVHAVGHDGDIHWFAMELVDGPDLARELRQIATRRDAGGRRLPAYDSTQYIGTVVDLVCQAADAMAAAHAAGVIHRDLKPSNLLLGPHAAVKVADFGLARDEHEPHLTATGDQVGTPHYMSPELVESATRTADARSDVYSLGVVLFELLTLRRPFEGKTSGEVWWKILHQPPPPLLTIAPRVPPDLATIVATAMAREPSERYPTAAALRDDLRRFLAHESIKARLTPLLRRAQRFARRYRGLLIAAAGVVVAALAGLGLALAAASAERRREDLAVIGRVVERAAGRQPTIDASGIPGFADAEADVAAAWRLLQQRTEDGVFGADEGGVVGDARALMVADKAFLCARILRLIEQGQADREDGYVNGLRSSFSSEHFAEALRVLASAQARYAGDIEVLDAARATRQFAEFTVALSDETTRLAPNADQAEVWIRRIDDVACTLSPPRRIGAPGPAPFREPRGHVRIVVVIPGWGFSEHTRWLDPSSAGEAIVARVRSTTDAAAGMKRIDAGVMKFDQDRIRGCCMRAADAPFDAYWIDEAELSNREVLDWAEGSGAPLPEAWTSGWCRDWQKVAAEMGEQFGDLPALGLSHREYTAVAEWTGKRLPTHVELERALRGRDMQRFPWRTEEERDQAGLANVYQDKIPANLGGEAHYRAVISRLMPVRASGYRQNPEGLFHAFGNVAEWTESALVEPFYGRVQRYDLVAVVIGMAWYAQMPDWVGTDICMATHETQEISAEYRSSQVGVRLARGGEPPR